MSATIGLWEHFKRLFDFGGREDRASFWPYAAVAFIIVMVIGTIIFVPVMTRTMQAMQEYAAQNEAGNQPPLPSADFLATYLGVTFGLAILLYAAAVVRRLHDRGLSGWWGLMPLPFIFYSSIQMPRMMSSPADQFDTTIFFSVFFSNLLYMVTLIALIVLLAGVGDPQPNRYDREI